MCSHQQSSTHSLCCCPYLVIRRTLLHSLVPPQLLFCSVRCSNQAAMCCSSMAGRVTVTVGWPGSSQQKSALRLHSSGKERPPFRSTVPPQSVLRGCDHGSPKNEKIKGQTAMSWATHSDAYCKSVRYGTLHHRGKEEGSLRDLIYKCPRLRGTTNRSSSSCRRHARAISHPKPNKDRGAKGTGR